MSVLYFTCQCSKKLATDSGDVDLPIQCPACNRRFKVPHPATSWACPSCGVKMFATFTLVGKMVKCVKCGYESKAPNVSASLLNTSPKSTSTIPSQSSKVAPSGKEIFTIIAIAVVFIILISIPIGIFLQYRPLNKAMKQALQAKDASQAVVILQNALAKYPNAPNAQEAKALLADFEEPIIQTAALTKTIAEADELVSKNQLWEAVDKLKISIRSNPKASNINEAKKKLEDLQIKGEHTANLEKVFNETLENTTSYQIAINTLERAIQTYPLAINRKSVEEKISEFKQIISDSDALQTAMKRAQNYPSSQSALQDLKLAIERYPKADCQKEARELYERLILNSEKVERKSSETPNVPEVAPVNPTDSSQKEIVHSQQPNQEVTKIDSPTSPNQSSKEKAKDLGTLLKDLTTRVEEVE